jgi:hypothetical protein
MGIEEREEVQAKGIENMCNKILAENYQNLRILAKRDGYPDSGGF